MDKISALKLALSGLRQERADLENSGHSPLPSTIDAVCSRCNTLNDVVGAINTLEIMLAEEMGDPFTDLSDTHEFFMLYSPQGTAPTYKHATESSATVEAERLLTHGYGLSEVYMLVPVMKMGRGEPPIVRTDYRKREATNAERADHN